MLAWVREACLPSSTSQENDKNEWGKVMYLHFAPKLLTVCRIIKKSYCISLNYTLERKYKLKRTYILTKFILFFAHITFYFKMRESIKEKIPFQLRGSMFSPITSTVNILPPK